MDCELDLSLPDGAIGFYLDDDHWSWSERGAYRLIDYARWDIPDGQIIRGGMQYADGWIDMDPRAVDLIGNPEVLTADECRQFAAALMDAAEFLDAER